MNWFEIKEENQQKISDSLKFLLDPHYISEKKLLQSWIDEFIVKDGINKTINEFQSELFRSVFWEIYLNKIFLELGFGIDPKKTSPDFLLIHKKTKHKYSVEAVIANFPIDKKGEEKQRNNQDIYGDNDIYRIIEESIPRVTNAISKKVDLYRKAYCKDSDISSNPYIIAIHDYGQINYGQISFYSMLCVLYNAQYDPEDKLNLKILCNDDFGNEYKYRESYEKENGGVIDLGFFNSDKFKDISGVLFSCTVTLGKLTSLCKEHLILPKFIITERLNGYSVLRYSNCEPTETLADGLFLFINPYAENPIDSNLFNLEGITIVYYEQNDGEIYIDHKYEKLIRKSPLIRRKVGMKGMENELIDDIDKFIYIPTMRTNDSERE